MPTVTEQLMELQKKLDAVPDSECSCERCKSMCEYRACWPTPKEAQALINAGYGERLWVDYWAGGGLLSDHDNDISILAPAAAGKEKEYHPFWPEGRCTFLTKDGLCELHDQGLKPSEGRKAIHSDEDPVHLHAMVATMWDEEAAEHLVEEWLDRFL